MAPNRPYLQRKCRVKSGAAEHVPPQSESVCDGVALAAMRLLDWPLIDAAEEARALLARELPRATSFAAG